MTTSVRHHRSDLWLQQVHADRETTDDIRKVASAIADCAPPDGYLGLGGDNVFVDEFLFQLADDLTDLRAVTAAIHWLSERGYLDIVANTCTARGSFLICGLGSGGGGDAAER
jgi:hypothetical protein